MYTFLDLFFVVFHSILIVFNVFGWIWKKTRKINLYTLLLTGASWFILGIFKGLGYCPLTDWHWKVLMKLGRDDLPNSYIKYLVDRIFNTNVSALLVDNLTAIIFFVVLIISVVLNSRDYYLKKVKTKKN